MGVSEKMKKCPNCGKEITQEMVNANMCWECGFILDSSLADDISDTVTEQREELSKREYAKAVAPSVEYDVETLVTNSDGFTDVKEMKRILAERVNNGWRLHSVYSNILGVNAVKVLGIGTNATISETVMLFERSVKA